MTNKFIAGWTLSNHGGVGVIAMTDESMTVQYYDNEPEEVEIFYDETPNEYLQYIMIGQLKLYLNECIRYK